MWRRLRWPSFGARGLRLDIGAPREHLADNDLTLLPANRRASWSNCARPVASRPRYHLPLRADREVIAGQAGDRRRGGKALRDIAELKAAWQSTTVV